MDGICSLLCLSAAKVDSTKPSFVRKQNSASNALFANYRDASIPLSLLYYVIARENVVTLLEYLGFLEIVNEDVGLVHLIKLDSCLDISYD